MKNKALIFTMAFASTLTLVALAHFFIMYLIVHPIIWEITVWIIVVLFALLGLRNALRIYLYDGGIEEDFKAKKGE